MLQGMYSGEALDIAESGKLERYQQARLENEESSLSKPWKNVVARTWNTIMQASTDDEDELCVEIDLLTGQLQDLDAIFQTHFGKHARFFMTSSSSWRSIVPTYVDALTKYADNLAQQPGRGNVVKTIREALPDKMTWVMTDHGALHFAPAMPLMTRSTVAVVCDSLRDIGLAIYEVSHRIVYTI